MISNKARLWKEFGENKKINRIKKSVQTILDLQINLRAYLNGGVLQKEEFNLRELIEQRVEAIESSYEKISFQNRVTDMRVNTSRDALTRIIDNLLSNAGKYNKENGIVEIYMDSSQKILSIKDSGKGIKNPQKIFDRFYKEHDRGVGIGLHIVKKLVDELGMKISVETELDKGSVFHLNIIANWHIILYWLIN